MVNDTDILDDFLHTCRNLRVFSYHGYRSPGKPLLVLLAIGHCLNGRPRQLQYEDIKDELTVLLSKYGRFRKIYKPNMPFYRLQTDGIWEIPYSKLLNVDKAGDVSEKQLIEYRCTGGFKREFYDALQRNPLRAWEICYSIVLNHFSPTLQSEVLFDALGGIPEGLAHLEEDHIQFRIWLNQRKRDTEFRKMVLNKYDYKCALCDFKIEFPTESWPALEAAHIKWHCHNGPDSIDNGLSLCSTHHSLFDRGIFTINPSSYKVVLSDPVVKLNPNSHLKYILENKEISLPRASEDHPSRNYLDWHRRIIFKGHFAE